MKLLLMADGVVGRQISGWLVKHYPDDVALVVTTSENEIFSTMAEANIDCCEYGSAEQVCDRLRQLSIQPDLGILAWWPNLIKEPLLGIPRHGFVNTHPSLLPHNRGKHPNFWSLVTETPFGTTLHMVSEGIDEGDIVAQVEIPYDWQDDGGTLYQKGQDETVRLFQDAYPDLRTLSFPRVRQDSELGSFHRAKDLEPACEIDLNSEYRARDLLNLIRARTFDGHPACTFSDNGIEYEVRIKIQRKV